MANRANRMATTTARMTAKTVAVLSSSSLLASASASEPTVVASA